MFFLSHLESQSIITAGLPTKANIPTVEFRLIVFRPFKHEVITGRISSATEAGIRSMTLYSSLDTLLAYIKLTPLVRTPFFDEIHVPVDKLPQGSELYLPSLFPYLNLASN